MRKGRKINDQTKKNDQIAKKYFVVSNKKQNITKQ